MSLSITRRELDGFSFCLNSALCLIVWEELGRVDRALKGLETDNGRCERRFAFQGNENQAALSLLASVVVIFVDLDSLGFDLGADRAYGRI